MSAANISVLRTLPFAQLRQNRYFYLYYDGFYALLGLAGISLMLSLGHKGFFGEGAMFGPFQLWHLALFPLFVYFFIMCHVLTHVCTHNSLPRPLNRIVGELCGLFVVVRFASWEVVHQRHHRFSDDFEKDPHPCLPSYFKHLALTVVNVEKQLQQTYYELYGDTPETRAYEKRRAYVSYATNAIVIAMFYVFAGPIGFFVFLLPASLLAACHLVHFNWSTHNAKSPTGDYKPVNLDYGYYRVGNKLFLGIYMHANHHKWPTKLNPTYVKSPLPLEAAPTAEDKRRLAELKRTWQPPVSLPS